MMTPIKRSGILQKTAGIQNTYGYRYCPKPRTTAALLTINSSVPPFVTVTAVKSDKTRQKDRQMTTYRQTAAETSLSNKMPSETRSDGIFAQLRQGLKPPANQIVL